MSTVEVKMNLPFEELLNAIEQVSLPELERLVGQVLQLQAERRAPVLAHNEADLLLKINQQLPMALKTRSEALISKRQAETLTSAEHEELIRLTDEYSALNVQRLGYLTELAQLRQTTLPQLMQDLKIELPTVI